MSYLSTVHRGVIRKCGNGMESGQVIFIYPNDFEYYWYLKDSSRNAIIPCAGQSYTKTCEAEPVGDTYWEIYCKELAYVSVGSG